MARRCFVCANDVSAYDAFSCPDILDEQEQIDAALEKCRKVALTNLCQLKLFHFDIKLIGLT